MIVADTHAALWHIFDNPKLSRRAAAFFDEAAAGGNKIVVSSISLVEIVYLVEKRRLPETAYSGLREILGDPDEDLMEVPVTGEISDAMHLIPRADVPDMPDRIIAATALHLGVPVLSRDRQIHSANLQTIW